MADFDSSKLVPEQFEMDDATFGARLKNLKEIKVSNGVFYVDGAGNLEMRNSEGTVISTWTNEGKIEIRDSNGSVVILIDPNG